MTGVRPKLLRPAADNCRFHAASSRELSGKFAVNGAGSDTLSSAAVSPSSNLARFLDATTPSLPAHYLPEICSSPSPIDHLACEVDCPHAQDSQMRTGRWRTIDTGNRPYFTLEELWESFEEWSAYGAGVPLVLDGCESVVQYYVPYISGIQLYGLSSEPTAASRGLREESDSDSFRDSSSDASSDYEHERSLMFLQHWSGNHHESNSLHAMNNLSLKDTGASEDFSSDDSEVGTSVGCLLFQYFERNPPYCREPLANKILDLARRFPELWTLRSCDLSPASWISVAWYPIYRIPTGATLKDLDACFLTFHSISTSMEGDHTSPTLKDAYPQGVNDISRIQPPIFGLASYKLKGSMWMPYGGYEKQLVNSLQQAAATWLQVLQVDHPDYRFFASNGAHRR